MGCDRLRWGRLWGSLTALGCSPHLARRNDPSRSSGVLPQGRVEGAGALRGRASLFPQRKTVMTPQEQDLLTTLLARLKNTANQPKDPEADALIRQATTEQPDA